MGYRPIPVTPPKPLRERGRRPARAGRPQRLAAGPLLLIALWVGGGALASLGGCASETRYEVLSTVFDGVPPPGSERVDRRRRRQPPAPEPAAVVADVTPEDLAPKPEPDPDYETYEEIEAKLPKDSMGNVDWVAAVEAGLIRPRPGPDPETPEGPVLPFDVKLDPGIPQFEVVFPHAQHTYWLRCDSCHPSIFQMRAGANPITMAKIFEGEYCGKCHGTVAFPPQTGCPRCHAQLGG